MSLDERNIRKGGGGISWHIIMVGNRSFSISYLSAVICGANIVGRYGMVYGS